MNIFATHLCASTSNKKSPSHGDSGGALILQDSDPKHSILIGVFAFGAEEGSELGHPVVYTRITSYLLWIEKVTKTIFTNDVD